MTKEDMPTMAEAYSFRSLDPQSKFREVRTEKEFVVAAIRIHEKDVCEIIERYIRDKYNLSVRHAVKVILLDTDRTDDAAKIEIEIEKGFFEKSKVPK